MIIPVTNRDLIPSVARLAAEIWTEHFTPIIGADQVAYMLQMFQSEEAIAEQINQGYQYFLIEIDGRYAGYFSLQPRDDELHLSKFYIHAAHRGQGLGRQAMTFIEEIAAREGLKKITLVVNKYNHTSIQIYEKLGFKNVAAMVTDIGNDFVMDDYKLEKDLT